MAEGIVAVLNAFPGWVTSQVWEAWIRDEKEQLVAQGRERVLG